MKRYDLFREFRNISIYGENPADALMRKRTLRRADVLKRGVKVAEGELVEITRVLGIDDTSTRSSTRDGAGFIRVIVEFIDGRAEAIDVKEASAP